MELNMEPADMYMKIYEQLHPTHWTYVWTCDRKCQTLHKYKGQLMEYACKPRKRAWRSWQFCYKADEIWPPDILFLTVLPPTTPEIIVTHTVLQCATTSNPEVAHLTRCSYLSYHQQPQHCSPHILLLIALAPASTQLNTAHAVVHCATTNKQNKCLTHIPVNWLNHYFCAKP